MDFEKLIVPLEADFDKYKKDLDKVEKETDKSTKSMSSKFSSFAKNATKALAGLAVAGFGAVVAGAGLALDKTLEWGSTLDSVQDHMGNTNEEAAGLALMFQTVGSDVSQLTSSVDKMTKGLWSANGELGASGKAIQGLGINLSNADGSVKTSTQLFQEIADKLSLMPEGLEKNALLMDIFGKSGVELGDALSAASNGGLQEFMDKANGMGLVFDQEQIDKSIEYQKKLEELNGVVDGLKVQFGLLVLEGLEPLITKFNAWAQDEANQEKIKGFFKQLGEDVPKTIDSISKAIDLISDNKWILDLLGGLVSIGITFKAAALIAGLFGTTLSALAAPVLILIGAVGLLVFLIVTKGKDAWNTVNMLAQIFWAFWLKAYWWLKDTFVGAIDGIKNAVAGVIGWVRDLGNAFSNLSIPDWLTPGSPTPLEIGLLGINKALKKVSANALPEFSAEVAMQGSLQNIQTNDNSKVEVLLQELINKTGMDYQKMAIANRDVILQAVG